MSNPIYNIIVPKPTLEELIQKYMLTPSQYKEVFDNHDSGDEDNNARRYALFICGKRPRATPGYCTLDPSHWGPCSWQK